MVYNYKTISESAETLYKEKASKFYGFSFPVKNEMEVKEHLDRLRKKYFDSNHVCYAFVLGNEKQIWRASDDGEPSNTAGKPILGQIQGNDLTNVLIAVVRYFGGTKLGTGGLIQAYRQTAYDVLQKNEIILIDVKYTCQLTFTYAELSNVLNAVKKFHGKIISNEQYNECTMTIEIALSDKLKFNETIERNILSLKEIL